MNLKKVRDALLTVGVPVSHYAATKQPDKYIVWSEDSGAETVWADGALQEQTIQGSAHYFTKTEYDANVEKVQQALSDAGISFRMNSVQYEEDTKYIHHEWVWEVC